jgi:hypothetical protein
MKSLLKCEILMNFHDNEFCAILICFIGDKVYSKEWTIWCGLGVKILHIFYFLLNQTINFEKLWMTIY